MISIEADALYAMSEEQKANELELSVLRVEVAEIQKQIAKLQELLIPKQTRQIELLTLNSALDDAQATLIIQSRVRRMAGLYRQGGN